MVGREEQQQKKKKEREQTSPSNAMLNKQPVKDFPCPLRQIKCDIKKQESDFLLEKFPTPFGSPSAPFTLCKTKKRIAEIDDGKSRTTGEELFLIARTERPSRI
jgi:hypothetical protein